jgi:hypothetical protein
MTANKSLDASGISGLVVLDWLGEEAQKAALVVLAHNYIQREDWIS